MSNASKRCAGVCENEKFAAEQGLGMGGESSLDTVTGLWQRESQVGLSVGWVEGGK
jgi:hypothetical protein